MEAPNSSRLHYISVEKYPLSREALADAHGLFPELEAFSQKLLSPLAEPLPGIHRYHFEEQQVSFSSEAPSTNDYFEPRRARRNRPLANKIIGAMPVTPEKRQSNYAQVLVRLADKDDTPRLVPRLHLTAISSNEWRVEKYR